MPVAFLKQVGDDRHRAGLPGMAIEQRMERGVQLSPAPDVVGAQLRAVFLQDPVELAVILGRQVTGGRLQEPRLEQRPELEELLNLLGRKLGNDGAAVGVDLDQPFRLELHQGLANRDAAHPEFGGERILPQRDACLEIPIEDPGAQILCHCCGNGPVLEGFLRGPGGWLGWGGHEIPAFETSTVPVSERPGVQIGLTG